MTSTESAPFKSDGPLGGSVTMAVLGIETSTVPLARDVNLLVPQDADWLFRKSPIAVAAGNDTITVSVPDDGRQFLAWVPYDVWTNGSPPDLSEWAQTSVTIQRCPANAVGFLGGVLGLSADRCFAMTFRSGDGVTEERKVRLDGHPCAG